MGIPLVVHYSGIWDDAAMAAHPEWARVAADGRRDEGKACLTGPYTATYMIPQMLEILERYDVDGFWVDGENWAARPCYCDRCRRLFSYQHGTVPAEAGQPLWAEWLLFHRRAFEA